MSNNRIRTLDKASFSGLGDLVMIDLGRNLLTSLPQGLFDDVSQLSYIYLHSNLLSAIEPMLFIKLESLIHVDLSDNFLVSVSDRAVAMAYHNYGKFTSINLSGNYLDDIPIWLLQLPFLEDIDLSGNEMSFESIRRLLQKLNGSGESGKTSLEVTPLINLQNNAFTDFDISTLDDDLLVHYADVIMTTMASQITSLTDVYSTVYSDADQRKHQSSASLAFVWGIHQDWWIPRTKCQLRGKCFHLMTSSCVEWVNLLYSCRLNFGENVFNCNCKMYSLQQYMLIYNAVATVLNASEVIGHDNINYNYNGFNCGYPMGLRGNPLIQVPVDALGCNEPLPTCPKHCRCWVRSMDKAVKVDCANQNLTRLPLDIPDGSVALNLSNNQVIELQRDVPSYISFLQVLDLSGNYLQGLSENIIKAGYNISDLRLHNNELTTLPKTVRII